MLSGLLVFLIPITAMFVMFYYIGKLVPPGTGRARRAIKRGLRK